MSMETPRNAEVSPLAVISGLICVRMTRSRPSLSRHRVSIRTSFCVWLTSEIMR